MSGADRCSPAIFRVFAPSNGAENPRNLKDVLMDSSELFSHPQAAQPSSPGDTSHEAVAMPVFSDLPQKGHPGDSPTQ